MQEGGDEGGDEEQARISIEREKELYKSNFAKMKVSYTLIMPKMLLIYIFIYNSFPNQNQNPRRSRARLTASTNCWSSPGSGFKRTLSSGSRSCRNRDRASLR